jgi:predicted DNA-binding transcriptional regulator YafY
MAINKNALIRYKVLDSCFRNPGRNFFINDLINECNKVLREISSESNGISRRQIYQDIVFMESSEGWSVNLRRCRDGKKVYYRYEDNSFSINNMPLNDLEINQLQEAIDILSQFKGMPQFGWIHELVPKLNQGIGSDNPVKTIIEFDSNQYLKGIEHLGALYNAILYNRVLNISYRPFQSENPYNVVIHPYYIKQYNNRWFLFGYNPGRKKDDWNLALDRILDVKETTREIYKQTQVDWSEYFEDIIGVTKPLGFNIEKITLHFKGMSGNYIETKPIHGSQKSKWISNDILEINLQLIINYEFERLIISYGEDVRVIMPASLRDKIVERLKRAHNQYETPNI